MAGSYRLIAVPHLLAEGELKGHFETVTFTAESGEGEVHKWWSVNTGTFEADFSKIVNPVTAREIVNRLRAGETVQFPGSYRLEQFHGFGGRWSD
jgi:hypothetical protein